MANLNVTTGNDISSDTVNNKYIGLLTIVATLGGLLFGYDTAVVNGAEKSLVSFYISGINNITNYSYAYSLVSQFHILLAIVLYAVSVIVGLQIIKLFPRKSGITFVVVFCLILTWWIKSQLLIQFNLNDLEQVHNFANDIKGFIIASALIGCIIGGAVAGFIAKKFGRKNGLILSALLFLISAIGASIPEKLNFFNLLPAYSFTIYRILGGVGVGIASMLSPMYIAEIAPSSIRGRLVSWNQFAIILGMLIIYFVNYGIACSGSEDWLNDIGWRYMFLSGAIPALIFLILLFFLPETPRYLVECGKDKQALDVLSKIIRPDDAKIVVSEIKQTMHAKNAPWLSFGISVIIIGVFLSIFQQFIGINVVLYYAGNIFRNMGFDTNSSLLQTIIVGAINLVFTVIAILFVDKVGRKPLLIIGAIGMAISMAVLGFMFYFNSLGAMALFFMLAYVASFAVSWGPVVWVVLSEIFPNSIRGAMSIAVSLQWIANWIVSLTFPMLNDNLFLIEKFHHGVAYWIYSIMGLIAAFFVWKFVPETKGKTLECMEKLWNNKNKIDGISSK